MSTPAFTYFTSFTHTSHTTSSLLSHNAAVNDDVALATALLSKSPACLEAKNELGQSPFHFCCMVGSANVALLLLQKGADVPVKGVDRFAFTSKFYAQRHKMTAVLALLKEQGK
jgi:ankyrin repeat protein